MTLHMSSIRCSRSLALQALIPVEPITAERIARGIVDESRVDADGLVDAIERAGFDVVRKGVAP